MVHEIHGSRGAPDEEELHDGVVETDEAGDEVQVAADEHHQEEDLGLAGDARTAPGLPDLQQQQHDGQQVRQVTEQPEDVHAVCNDFLEIEHDL